MQKHAAPDSIWLSEELYNALDAAVKAPYGVILRVLDAVKAAGDADVALVMQ